LGICWPVRYNAARGDEMYAPKTIFTFALLFLLMLCAVVLVYSRMMQRIPKGEWGGSHIRMIVGERSATIEYDCAHGEIPGPLTIDSEGKFHLRGTFTRERGGPVRADDTPRPEPATYSGTIKGNVMTLTMKLSASDDTETFTLEKGKPAELFKCK
jgi:hypothetical protein